MLSYSGRIDFDDRLAPVLVYACSSIGMKFTGTSLKAVIANHRSCWTNELGYFIDGEQKRFTLSSDEEKKTYTLAEGLSEGTHELLLFKRMDSCHTFTFYGFEIDDAFFQKFYIFIASLVGHIAFHGYHRIAFASEPECYFVVS